MILPVFWRILKDYTEKQDEFKDEGNEMESWFRGVVSEE